MSDFDKKLFEEKIGKNGMEHFDNDLKFMGAHEICKMVIDGSLKSEMPEMDRYIDALLNKQLTPENTSDVKSKAITCISNISSKLNEKQIGNIVKKLIDYITNDTKEYEDVRDVFVMCMKNIIQEVPHDFHEKLAIVLTQSRDGISKAQRLQKYKIEKELVDIVTLMFKKWGNTYKDDKHKELVGLLKNNITAPQIDEDLRKKSCNSLGAISVMLDSQEVSALVKQFIQVHQQITDSQKQQALQKGLAQALNQLAKNAGQKMEAQIPECIELLNSQFQKWQLQENTDDFDFVSIVCELYEQYLNIIESLILRCSKSAFNNQMIGQIIKISKQLLTMDPNRSCPIQDIEQEEDENSDLADGSDMEVESDDDYLDSDVDQDDQSWRVRKSVLNLVQQLILHDKSTLNEVYMNFLQPNIPLKQNIINRLVEKNEGVRQTIINVLTTFINQIMVNDSTQQINYGAFDMEEDFGEDLQMKRITSKLVSFNILDVIKPIIKEIKDIYQDKKSNINIKISAFKLIENLSSSAGKQIIENQDAWKKMYEIDRQILNDNKADPEIKILILQSLKKILKFRQQQNLDYLQADVLDLFKICLTLLNDNLYKVKSTDYKLISGLLRFIQQAFPNSFGQFSDIIKQIIPKVLKDLAQSDIDQEIKQSVIQTANNLLNTSMSVITASQTHEILEILSKKLPTENRNRILILKLLKKIPIQNASHFATSEKVIFQIIQTCCTFLKKEDRSDRISSIEALNNLIKLYKIQNTEGLVKDIIDNSVQMITPKSSQDLDPSQADLILSIYNQLIDLYNKPAPQFEAILKGCLELTKANVFQSNRYDSLFRLFYKLAYYNLVNSTELIQKLVNEAQQTTIIASSCAIASLIQASKNKDQLIESITKLALNKSENVSKRQISLQSLSELGKKIDLTENKTIMQGILDLINNQDESLDQVRKYASIAFGGLSVQNLENALPKVIDLIKQKKNPYLMLNTLKEIIQNCNEINEKQLVQIIDFLFEMASKPVQQKETDIRNTISGCIGKLGVSNLKFLKAKLIQGLSSDNENLRLNCSSSFRFFFTKDVLKGILEREQDLRELAEKLLSIIGDKSLLVKESVVRSLNSIAFNAPHLIEQNVKLEFVQKMVPCFQHFDIQETDLGAFKDKRDKGAPLRESAFQFIKTALQFSHSYEFSELTSQLCMENMAKEPENDIKFLRASILLKLAKMQPQVLTVQALKVKDAMVAIMKTYVGKKPFPEGSIELVKTCCAVLDQTDKKMEQKNPDYSTFLSKLKTQDDQKFGKVFEEVADW